MSKALTVAEIIEILKKLPQEAPCALAYDSSCVQLVTDEPCMYESYAYGMVCLLTAAG